MFHTDMNEFSPICVKSAVNLIYNDFSSFNKDCNVDLLELIGFADFIQCDVLTGLCFPLLHLAFLPKPPFYPWYRYLVSGRPPLFRNVWDKFLMMRT